MRRAHRCVFVLLLLLARVRNISCTWMKISQLNPLFIVSFRFGVGVGCWCVSVYMHTDGRHVVHQLHGLCRFCCFIFTFCSSRASRISVWACVQRFCFIFFLASLCDSWKLMWRRESEWETICWCRIYTIHTAGPRRNRNSNGKKNFNVDMGR